VSTNPLEINVYKLSNDYDIIKIEEIKMNESEQIACACVLTTNKQLLITGHHLNGNGNKIKFWNLTTGLLLNEINLMRNDALIKLLQINSEHLLAFYIEDPLIEVFDLSKGILLASIDSQKYDLLSMMSCVTLSFNMNELLIGSAFSFSSDDYFDPVYQLKLWRWNFGTSVCVKTFKQLCSVWNLILLPPCDENNYIQTFAHTSGGWIHIWNIDNVDACMYSFEAHKEYQGNKLSGLSSISNQLMSYTSNEIKLWSLSNELRYKCVWNYNNVERWSLGNDILKIEMVPNNGNRLVLIGAKRDRLCLFDMVEKKFLKKEEFIETNSGSGVKKRKTGFHFTVDFI
jgi:hypothetical protein